MLFKQINKHSLDCFKGREVIVDIKVYTNDCKCLESTTKDNEKATNLALAISKKANVKALTFQELNGYTNAIEIRVETV